MKIIPLAFDSFGTRSMATFVETQSCNILIDPSVALGPLRHGLGPHPMELDRKEEHWIRIKSYAEKAQILIITHYHYDHHNPNEPEVFKNKELLMKHRKENINQSQKRRAAYFMNVIKGLTKSVEYSDGKSFHFGNTRIRFSKAVPHGTNTKLGYVIEVSIEENNFKFLHTSDVEGPSLPGQTAFILEENPDVVFCDGPMTYMLGYRYSKEALRSSIDNIKEIIRKTKVKKLVLDHHFLRDLNWEEKIQAVFDTAKKCNVEILTAAEFLGIENDLLEAQRPMLYNKYPVTEIRS
jgi:predicted metallo-beta-lactamase superfamily hydrolase